jgi:tetratricopeptide (TPR) repeat protein
MEDDPQLPHPPGRTTVNGKWFVIILLIVCVIVAGYVAWQIVESRRPPAPETIVGANGLSPNQEKELAKIQEGFAETVRKGLPQDRVVAATLDLLERAPNSGDARLLLAQAYLKNNKPDLAYKQLNLALKLEPDLLEARLLAGTLAIGMDKKAEADEHYKHALKIAPTNERARLHMAQNALAKGDTEQALSLAQAAVDFNPLSHQAQALLSEALHKKGDLEDALRAIGRAIELAPEKDRDQAIIYIRKQSTILRAMNKPQDALAALRKLTPQERAELGPLDECAQTLELMGRTDQAAVLCDEMTKNTPGDWRYASLSAKWWIKAGDPVQARKQLKVVETFQPGSPLAKQLAGQIETLEKSKP